MELPLDQSIPRFKGNEDRFDRFINGGVTDTFTTSGSVVIPSVAKFLKDKDNAINVAADGILAAAVAARNTASQKASDAAASAAAAATFDPSSYYSKTTVDSKLGGKMDVAARLGASAVLITDCNVAIDNGWYRGNAVANAPSAGYFIFEVIQWGAGADLIQTAYGWLGAVGGNLDTWRRFKQSNTWTAWFKLQPGQIEQDSRYARLAADSSLSAGYSTPYVGDGVKSGGANYTCLPAGGNMRMIQNGGPFNWIADPDVTTKSYTMICVLQNTATAGAISFIGFSAPPGGDPQTTSNGAVFICTLVKHGGLKTINLQAI